MLRQRSFFLFFYIRVLEVSAAQRENDEVFHLVVFHIGISAEVQRRERHFFHEDLFCIKHQLLAFFRIGFVVALVQEIAVLLVVEANDVVAISAEEGGIA